MNKKMNFIFEVEDFSNEKIMTKNNSNNFLLSFQNFLKSLDTNECRSDVTLNELKKAEKEQLNEIIGILKGEIVSVDNGKLSSINTTEKIISIILDKINNLVVIRKGIINKK